MLNRQYFLKNFNNGFTVFELMLVIALIGILAGISVPAYQSLQINNNLNMAANIIVQSLRQAQTLARGVDGDDSWGGYIQSGKIVIFKGGSFTGRDSEFDKSFEFPLSIISSGLQEIVFDKFSGQPQTAGIITLTASNNQTKTIEVNEKGTIDY